MRPVPLQGVCSYTVAAANDTVIVQFRESDSPLDVQMITAIQKAHPDFVAGCTSHGTIGSSPALRIYSMNKLPGDNYSDISLSISDEDLNFQLATVKGLARCVLKLLLVLLHFQPVKKNIGSLHSPGKAVAYPMREPIPSSLKIAALTSTTSLITSRPASRKVLAGCGNISLHSFVVNTHWLSLMVILAR